MPYQKYRGNSETKLFYLIDDLYGGINTEYSDDVSQRGEFRKIVNFDLDKRGVLSKRKGFGKMDALSQIFGNFIPDEYLPNTYLRDTYENSDEMMYAVGYDQIVYTKLIKDDNHCFRTLSAFTGNKAYRKYQEKYGYMNNSFELLIITTQMVMGISGSSTIWKYTCTLPQLERDPETGEVTDTETIQVTYEKVSLSDGFMIFPWKRNLINISTFEFYNKIYFVENNRGILVYDRTADTLEDAISYAGYSMLIGDDATQNSAYKPIALEATTYGFNVIGGDKYTDIMSWLDTEDISTDSIRAIQILSENGNPVQNIPYASNFKIAIYYSGQDSDPVDSTFTISIKSNNVNSGYEDLDNMEYTSSYNDELSIPGQKAVYDISLSEPCEQYVEVAVTKSISNLSYHSYFTIGDINDTEILPLDLDGYKVIEFNSRALYYKGNTLWFSHTNIPTYIPNFNHVELPLDIDDKIMKIEFFRNVYVIFTKYKIYKMTSDDITSANFSITLLNDTIGCCAADTIVPIENVLYFMSDRGLYMLTSNYSYNTSTSALTFENVKELDDKVKSLTNNFSYDSTGGNIKSTTFNNISEYATAIRYNNKYMLFYNNYPSDIASYATQNNIDALVYDYELKSFTTSRFKYKPTFLFMVDNRIEVYAKFPTTGINNSKLLDYNFVDSIYPYNNQTGTPKTLTPSGDVSVGTLRAALFNGENSYMNVGDIHISDEGIENLSIDFHAGPRISEYSEDYKTLLDLYDDTVEEEIPFNISAENDDGYIFIIDGVTSRVNSNGNRTNTVNKITLIRPEVVTEETITANLYIQENGEQDIWTRNGLEFNFELLESFAVIDNLNYSFFSIDGTSDYSNFWTFTLVDSNSSIFNIETDYFVSISSSKSIYSHIKLEVLSYSVKLTVSDYRATVSGVIPNYANWQFNTVTLEYQPLTSNYKMSLYRDRGAALVRTITIEESTRLFVDGLGGGSITFDDNYIGVDRDMENYYNGTLSYITLSYNNSTRMHFELYGDYVDAEKVTATTPSNLYAYHHSCLWYRYPANCTFSGGYLKIPEFDNNLNNGFKIVTRFKPTYSEGKMSIFEFADEDNTCIIKSYIENSTIKLSVISDNKTILVTTDELSLSLTHTYTYEIFNNDSEYVISILIDDVETPITVEENDYGAILETSMTNNYIGKSSDADMFNFLGNMYSFILYTPGNKPCIFEYDTTYSEFGKPMDILIETKGYNLEYPQHIKKLKKVFIKAIGGYTYQSLYFVVYRDNFRVNELGTYRTYIDENGVVVYEFIPEFNLSISAFDIAEYDKANYGEQIYQMQKFSVPAKGKNFSMQLYGETDDRLELSSFGLVCKLSKVKE